MSISQKLRFQILCRDGFQCRYCGRKPPQVSLEVDHVHPASDKGPNHPDNLITACMDCNQGKSGSILPISSAETASHIFVESIDPRDSFMDVAYRDPYADIEPIQRCLERRRG